VLIHIQGQGRVSDGPGLLTISRFDKFCRGRMLLISVSMNLTPPCGVCYIRKKQKTVVIGKSTAYDFCFSGEIFCLAPFRSG
jgi:hypothetical protein